MQFRLRDESIMIAVLSVRVRPSPTYLALRNGSRLQNMKRVGIIALLHESNTFLGEPTTLAHFEADVFCSGAEVLDTFRDAPHEVGGFIEALNATSDIGPVGIFAARAMPFGPITAACWDALMARLQRELRAAGLLDGVLVAPHGAAVTVNAPDADGDWLSRLRHEVGAHRPIIGTLDLHANVSTTIASACDALIGYQTNPHLDQRERGLEAGRLMVRTLRGEVRPKLALCQLPLCVNIERQATAEPHGLQLWGEADRLARDVPNILSASCLYGFPYADVADMGASVIAVANGDTHCAREAARRLAQRWWQMRQQFVGQLVSIEKAVAAACQERERDDTRPVGLLDMGDNVGGGSTGYETDLIKAWVRSGCGPILAVLFDPAAVRTAQSIGVGNCGRVQVGGKTDGCHGSPLDDIYEVTRIGDGTFSETQPRHGGYIEFDQGPTATLQSDSGVTLVVSSRRVAPWSLQQLVSQGIEPADYAAIVIKGVHAPVAAYAPVCSRLIRVNTPGATCADVSQFPFKCRRRPMFPFELDCVWEGDLGSVDSALSNANVVDQ